MFYKYSIHPIWNTFQNNEFNAIFQHDAFEPSELKNESQTDSDTLPVICCVNRILIFITIEFWCMISLKLTFQYDNPTNGWPFIWSIMCLLTVLDSIKTSHFMDQFTEICICIFIPFLFAHLHFLVRFFSFLFVTYQYILIHIFPSINFNLFSN